MFTQAISRIKGTVIFRGGIAAIDQGMLSAVNLAVQLILINTVAKGEYGYYSVAFSVVLYMISFQNAVVNTPITVTLASKSGEVKSKYLSSIFSGQLSALAVFAIVGTLMILLIYFFGLGINESMIAGSLCLASFGILNREFLRSYFYTEERPLKVLKLDSYYAMIYLGLIGISFLVYKVSVPLVIVFMGFAAGFDSLILNKSFKLNFNFNYIKEAYKENWQISKWSVIGVTVTQLQNYSYLYVVGFFLGSTAMADVSASRLLLMPLSLVINGWSSVIRPYGAKLREANQLKKFFKNLVIAVSLYPIIVFSIAIVLNLLSGFLLRTVFNQEYQNVFDYIFYWALIFSVLFIRANASYGLQVVKKFKSLAMFNAITMVITVILAVVLTYEFQVKGALIASLTGECIFATVLWRNLYLAIFKPKVKK